MKMMNRILEKTTLLSSFLDEDKLKEYKEILSNLKVEKLYHSKIHGEYHSEKVSLFAFILANEYHLDEVDKQIIIDAALYHDIGRMNDLNECFHGLASANRIGFLIPLKSKVRSDSFPNAKGNLFTCHISLFSSGISLS